ncbi:class A sortase [Lacticaseibacillus zhaodongensis]|uniref:class A sortase n=1 Tax=Lacticaseibacillus zhaodongensis TaxID=2668065 RepID=UPI0012D2C08E|nr:class A sortase [Lacticaseibacillus zhaodongensis]
MAQGDKKKQKRGGWRTWAWRIFIVLGFAVSLALIFNEQIKLFMVNQMSQSAVRTTQTLKKSDVKKNKKVKASYDFAKVEALDLNNVTKAAVERNLKPIGMISVPSVSIYLPIMKGLGGNNLAVGAGTMKPDQQMGKRNYALAGHHIHKQKTLFSPLENVRTGANIYITDKSTVYTYKIDFQKVVDKSQVQYIDDIPGKNMITLVTCSSNQILQPERHIIQGQLVHTAKATNKTLRVFANQ